MLRVALTGGHDRHVLAFGNMHGQKMPAPSVTSKALLHLRLRSLEM